MIEPRYTISFDSLRNRYVLNDLMKGKEIAECLLHTDAANICTAMNHYENVICYPLKCGKKIKA